MICEKIPTEAADINTPIEYFINSFKEIDWSLYELVEVVVIPVDEFPSEEEIIQNEHLITDEYENASKDQKWFMGVGFRLCATWLLNKLKGV